MIVYNITIKVEPSIEREWVLWQKEEYIPGIMSLGLFHEYKFYRLLEQDESEGITYVIQFSAADIHHYNKFIDSFASVYLDKAFEKWGNKFIAFRTIMQIVN